MPSSFRFSPRLALFFVVLAPWHPLSTRADDAEQQAGACVACHPKSGVPAMALAPVIWGQNAGYVYVQLRDFKSATRASPNDAQMHAITQLMSDAQMLTIAKYVSAQAWPESRKGTTASTDPLFQRGAQLVAYGDCGACHFNNWQGYSATPRLRGQTPAYLTTTIYEFRSGKRANSPGMSDLLRSYSEEDIKAIVAYLSSLD